MREQLAWTATHDALTKLINRREFESRLGAKVRRREDGPFSALFIDLDRFKAVNDLHGHEGGDRVLAAVANHISRNLRPFDDAWRWGGEEVLLCLKEADMDSGAVALERVRAGLEALPILLADGQVLNVTASFGLCAASRSLSVEQMIERTDKALYRAKQGGRNRVERADL